MYQLCGNKMSMAGRSCELNYIASLDLNEIIALQTSEQTVWIIFDCAASESRQGAIDIESIICWCIKSLGTEKKLITQTAKQLRPRSEMSGYVLVHAAACHFVFCSTVLVGSHVVVTLPSVSFTQPIGVDPLSTRLSHFPPIRTEHFATPFKMSLFPSSHVAAAARPPTPPPPWNMVTCCNTHAHTAAATKCWANSPRTIHVNTARYEQNAEPPIHCGVICLPGPKALHMCLTSTHVRVEPTIKCLLNGSALCIYSVAHFNPSAQLSTELVEGLTLQLMVTAACPRYLYIADARVLKSELQS